MSLIVKAVRGRMLKDRCPVCETPFRHGHCYTCPESAKQVRDEHAEKITALALDGARIVADGEEVTLQLLQEALNISARVAGEPSLDNEGNVYFVHHYYRDGTMLEADIYVIKKK